ncbi:TetR/AcrR family transcriptional regulator [Noviluteimonas gilva]|uniref:TetR family transcriptional regulator n=1 Tax=Noviluteimonas gilva TaxID=2682097 RepID=A0A7C9LII5_9GAMM|nr:TetR/AcrR family transcriptional regulator [Lysobacter gilvus]MUV15741.1 TetR family transcriptional regulator [Lysobacter gilvus]
MSSLTTPSRLTDRKRAAIVDAAVAEFRQSGFAATSMDKIAASAGVSKRTVYNHFPSKEALFAQILEQMWERSIEGLDLVYRKDRPLRDQLLELLQQKLELLRDENYSELARVAIAAGLHAPELARELVTRMGNREEGLTTWIRAAAADGRLKTDDPLFAAMQMHALVKGFAFWPQIALGQPLLTLVQQKKAAESAVDMFLAYYA